MPMSDDRAASAVERILTKCAPWQRLFLGTFAVVAGLALWALVVTVPMDLGMQALFAAFMFVAALFLWRRSGEMVHLVLIIISLATSTRYIYWRITETMGYQTTLDTVLGVGLLLCELYAFTVLVLGYFQTVWPLKRTPAPLPDNVDEWPTVDVFIPTYNEPLKVVKPAVIAALEMDWPRDKLNVYLLDDGRREEFAEFAKRVGVQHLTRPDNKHAKAGNINAALARTDGEYVAIFDCDHIPTRSFLQTTMGWFLKDSKLGMLQTPHHFFSPDPFERNLGTFKQVPNEGELFYGLVQDGNDFWNATFFCGSCAVLRRTHLEDVGGVAVETVTEDAHTALKMHSRGYNTAYLGIAQAAGLATESLSAHVGQRVRWARGMAQIFRMDNPLIKRGLALGQRFCYANAMLHFFYGLPRLVFLTAPLSFLFFEAHIIQASALTIASFALPHLIHANMTNSQIQGRYRYSFWSEVYEATLAAYITIPTTLAMINPKLGSFNVTAKGGLVEKEYFDSKIARPYLILFVLNALGLSVGVGRLLWWNTFETGTVVLNMAWTTYNLIILGATLAVAWEARQVRQFSRIENRLPAMVRLPNGRTIRCETRDFSEGGASIILPTDFAIDADTPVSLSLFMDEHESVLPARVVMSADRSLRVRFEDLTLEQEKVLVKGLYSRADNWINLADEREVDHPLAALWEVFLYGLHGLSRLLGLDQLAMALRLGRGSGKRPAMATRLGIVLLCGLLGVAGMVLTSGKALAADAGQVKHNYTFNDLGADKPLRIEGVRGQRSLVFPVREDELVRSAHLKLHYAYSPSLIEHLSHLNVILNDDLVTTLPLPTKHSDGVDVDIPIDVRLLKDYNRLTLELIGHYTTGCEDPLHSSLWALVSNTSEVELEGTRLALKDDLGLLPLPFFDPRDQTPLSLPMVFPANLSRSDIKAGGIVASWFGKLASYRTANFPTLFGSLPASGNAVVFLTTADGPSFSGRPRIGGPTLAVVPNPQDRYGKLLLVMGRDGKELEQAAKSLVLGHDYLSGSSMVIDDYVAPAPRKPYDAPKWLNGNHPVPFGEIADGDKLQVQGLRPDLVRVSFRTAPDLFTWRSEGIPMDLSYRFTPRPNADKSTLNVNVNGHFVQALPLTEGEPGDENRKLKIPFVQKNEAWKEDEVLIPAFQVVGNNQLQFHFFFEKHKEGECKDALVDNVRAAIDADSTIDVSQFPHYAAMPDLTMFANAGFPFTRLADLSQTAVVLPSSPSVDILKTYLEVMGRMGEATGYPTTGMAITTADQVDEYADKDLLVFGTPDTQPLLARWAEDMPLQLSSTRNQLPVPSMLRKLASRWDGYDLEDAVARAGKLVVGTDKKMAVLMGLQSPLQEGRSVVVIAANEPGSLERVAASLSRPAQILRIKGDMAIVDTAWETHSFQIGPHYYVGELSTITWLRWFLSSHPWFLMAVALLSSILLALVLYWVLKGRADKRQQSA
jgi:cellulose synthase (UDP-forming)